VRDQFSPREAVNATQLSTPKEAYNAIATNPQFANLLEQVPAKHPTQLYEAFSYIFVFAALYYMYWKTDVREKQGYLLGMFLIFLWSRHGRQISQVIWFIA
jgi:prolipoprotein diacylglyceryltransferase